MVKSKLPNSVLSKVGWLIDSFIHHLHNTHQFYRMLMALGRCSGLLRKKLPLLTNAFETPS
jgi:hypothetical protein